MRAASGAELDPMRVLDRAHGRHSRTCWRLGATRAEVLLVFRNDGANARTVRYVLLNEQADGGHEARKPT
jgi:hypothetical protein